MSYVRSFNRTLYKLLMLGEVINLQMCIQRLLMDSNDLICNTLDMINIYTPT